jgi:hypothetical protein
VSVTWSAPQIEDSLESPHLATSRSDSRSPFLAAALVGLATVCMHAPAVAQDPGSDAVTEKVRAVLSQDGGQSDWGAEPPDGAALARRGEPVAVTLLSGSGHAFVAVAATVGPWVSN